MPEITTTLRVPRYASAPGSPLSGQLYYDTTTNITYFYDGAAWQTTKATAATANALQTLTSKSISAAADPATGYKLMFGGSTWAPYASNLYATNTTSVSAAYAADTYLAGSTITVAAGDWKVQCNYHCRFDMVKTAAGVATPIVTVRMGTLGTTGDASIGTITFGAGTAVADIAMFDIDVNFRSVGSGTSAVVQMVGVCTHHGNAIGMTTGGGGNINIAGGTSAGFASTTQTKIGLSFNGGTAFSGSNSNVITSLHQP